MNLRMTLLAGAITVATGSTALAADADKTRYPIVFAHGMGGFDNILGFDYWGDDYGTFVLDACDKFLEVACNGDIDNNQRSYVSAVTPFHSSERRGQELANNIESYMASSGESYVNIVSHSQGGIDSRKAAKVLKLRKGYAVVKTHVSISSPHRGSPVAKYVLDNYNNSLTQTLANFFGNSIYASGNDAEAALKQLSYDDYTSGDGVTTGMRTFNGTYPASTSYIANNVSILTAQYGVSLNPALFLAAGLIYDIDGDGYCLDDCDGDGAAGAGDGRAWERDDDGLVGINSQQQGYRLEYQENFWGFDNVAARTDTGYVSDLNRPGYTPSVSSRYVLDQDHADVIGVGPDTFDEQEFYAAITDYIASRGH